LKYYVVLVISIFYSCFLFSQSIQGTVSHLDEDLQFANVLLLELDSSFVQAAVTDEHGFYQLNELEQGSYLLKFSYVGYLDKYQNVEIQSRPSPHVVNVKMEIRDDIPVCIVLGAEHPLQYSLSGNTTVNSLLITQESEDMAGTFGDPTRVLIRNPGLSIGNDQTNGIIYRGLSPDVMKWTFEGAEIVNPNHLSNASTLSDQPNSSSGGVLAMPFDIISEYKFKGQPSTGNRPLSIGGVSDFNFNRRGNSFVKVGLLGMEAGFQSQGKLDIKAHARYSTVGLLSDFGLDFGGEEIKFQDVFFRANLGKGFSLTSMMATSSTFRTGSDSLFVEREIDRYDSDYKSKIMVQGLSYKGQKSSHSLYFSMKNDKQRVEPDDFNWYDFTDKKISYHGQNENQEIETWWNLNYNFSERRALFGENIGPRPRVYDQMSYFNFQYGLAKSMYFNLDTWDMLIRPFLNLNFETLRREFSVEPGYHIQLAKGRSVFNLTGSISSQMQDPLLYLTYDYNDKYKRSKSFTTSAAFKHSFEKIGQVQIKAFYNNYYNQVQIRGELPMLNGVQNLRRGLDGPTDQNGTASTMGIEFMYDHTFGDGYYININTSFSDIKVDSFDAKYNFGHVSNLILSKSFMNQKLSFSLGAHYRGGAFETIFIDKRWDFYFESVQLPNYFRADLQIKFKFKEKNELVLDIQNVTNYVNYSHSYYKPVDTIIIGGYSELVLKEQLGIIPILSYKRIFN